MFPMFPKNDGTTNHGFSNSEKEGVNHPVSLVEILGEIVRL